MYGLNANICIYYINQLIGIDVERILLRVQFSPRQEKYVMLPD